MTAAATPDPSPYTPNTNDGSQRPPRLRLELNIGVLMELPEWSVAPRLPQRPKLWDALRAAGYEGVQLADDPAQVKAAGLAGATASGRVNKPGEALALARQWQAHGFDCATLHVGTELDDTELAIDTCADIVAASAEAGFPLYVETHRATITQDGWRTLRLVEAVPGLRINGDFSHWYTGHEMTYGDLEAKWAAYAPVFERVRFIHGRIGNSSHMQVDLGDGDPATYPQVTHFEEMWTRCFQGFLATAGPGDYICFAPELLFPSINYARLVAKGTGGALEEEGDRWTQSLLLTRIAKRAFAEAERRRG